MTMLQAQQIICHLEDINLIELKKSICFNNEIILLIYNKNLYKRIFSKNILINKTKISPQDYFEEYYEKLYI